MQSKYFNDKDEVNKKSKENQRNYVTADEVEKLQTIFSKTSNLFSSFVSSTTSSSSSSSSFSSSTMTTTGTTGTITGRETETGTNCTDDNISSRTMSQEFKSLLLPPPPPPPPPPRPPQPSPISLVPSSSIPASTVSKIELKSIKQPTATTTTTTMFQSNWPMSETNIANADVVEEDINEITCLAPNILLWHINHFNERKIDHNRCVLDSQPVYCNPIGSTESSYLMQFRIYLSGNAAAASGGGSGRGGVAGGREHYLSFYFRIIQGNFDEELQWPFSKAVDVGLLDKTIIKYNPDFLMEKDFRDPTVVSLQVLTSHNPIQKPSSQQERDGGGGDDEIIYRGVHRWIALSTVQNRYLVDNSLFIHIVLRNPNEMPNIYFPLDFRTEYQQDEIEDWESWLK